MGYRDPDQRRSYDRAYKQMRRAGEGTTVSPTQLPGPFRVRTARDVLTLLGEQVEAVRSDTELGTVERARTLCQLGGVLLKAVEAADLSSRIEAIERAMKLRKETPACQQPGSPGTTPT